MRPQIGGDGELIKANEVKVETADVKEYARKIARAQFTQYGMIGMGDDVLDTYVHEMLKREEGLRNIIDKLTEEKMFEAVKKSVKLTPKEVSMEEFNKMFDTK